MPVETENTTKTRDPSDCEKQFVGHDPDLPRCLQDTEKVTAKILTKTALIELDEARNRLTKIESKLCHGVDRNTICGEINDVWQGIVRAEKSLKSAIL